jgi:molybdopterin adenylyltransferase
MPSPLRAKILVLSDSVVRGERQDASGRAVRELLTAHGWSVTGFEVLPDDVEAIRGRLLAWTESEDCDAVFTTGGTGLGPRDVTPEATRVVIEKEVPGLADLMRAEGLKKTRRAALSRGVCGARHARLIVNLPGSVRGARESLESILDLLPHAIELLQGRTAHLG